MKTRLDFPGDDEPASPRLQHRFSEPVQQLIALSLDQVVPVLAAAERMARAGHWVVGFVTYEAAPAFDSALRVRPADGVLPLAAFAVYAQPDQPHDQPHDALTQSDADSDCGPWHMDATAAQAATRIATIRNAIGDGRYYQVNCTTHMRADFSGDGKMFFERLRRTQPDGYCIHIDHETWQVLSVSPELFFDWQADGKKPGQLRTKPMKGTAPRHNDPLADAAAAAQLAQSAKEQSENLMIVDLLRNDLAKVAVTGSVHVPQLFAVEALPTVWQMTSTVACTTRPEIQLEDVFRALFPCGSVTGAPKIAAMAAIAALETAPRGAYCGAIGVIRPGGHATFNVGIRTVTLDSERHRAECGIGSGVIWDSTAAGEYAEWLLKRRFLLRASADFKLIETLKLADGKYWLLAGHLARLQASAEYFGFQWDLPGVMDVLNALASTNARGEWRVRLLVDARGQPSVTCSALEPTGAGPLDVLLAAHPVDGSDEFLRHKTTHRSIYQAHQPPENIYDTLLWNQDGEITEFTRGNVVIELDQQRVTPPLNCGLLGGVLRGELLARGEISERVVKVEDLSRASGLWFINSVRGMLAVRRVTQER